jgi:hypothetical protein
MFSFRFEEMPNGMVLVTNPEWKGFSLWLDKNQSIQVLWDAANAYHAALIQAH